MKVILVFFLAAFSITASAQYSISIVGSGDQSKVRLVEYDDDITRTSLYKPMTEADAALLQDSLTIVHDRVNTSLDEALIQYEEVIATTLDDLKRYRAMKRRIERRIVIRDQQ